MDDYVFPSLKVFWQYALAGINPFISEREQSTQIITVAVEPAVDFRDRHLADWNVPALRQPFLHGMAGGPAKGEGPGGRQPLLHFGEAVSDWRLRRRGACCAAVLCS